MGVAESLRSIDRRVLPETRKSPKAWRKAAARWWVLLIAAGVYVAAAVVAAALMTSAIPRVLALAVLLPWTVFFGYAAGLQRTENDRLHGRDTFAKRRPPGL
jgi:uncharacterized membrane protein